MRLGAQLLRYFGVERGHIVPVSAAQPDRAPLDKREQAEAVHLGFEEPAIAVERPVGELGQHRLDRGRETRLGPAAGEAAAQRRGIGKPPRLEVVDGQLREYRRAVVQHVGAGPRVGVLMLDEQPLALTPRGLHQRPGAAQFSAPQREGELARRQPFLHAPVRRLTVAEGEDAVLVRRVDAGVPDDHLAGAIVPRRDHRLEGQIIQRVVLDHDRQPLLVGIERRPLGHGPRLQRPADLQPHVIVQTPRGVLLHHKAQAAPSRTVAAPRLRRPGEVALLLIAVEHSPLRRPV